MAKHYGAVIWGGRAWPRQERRRLTLAAAKRELRNRMLKRRHLRGIWQHLMRNFPAGTLD